MRAVAVFAVLLVTVVAVGAVNARLVSGEGDSDPPTPLAALENPAIPPDPVGGPGPLLVPPEGVESSSLTDQVYSTERIYPTEPVLPALVKSSSTDVPHARYPDAKQYMLDLINEERRKAGVPDVSLGNNNAAQIHAENMIRECFVAHWGTDGLGPPMRYSLAGGYQSNAENVSGYDYCLTDEDRNRYSRIQNLQTELREKMDGYMESSGHKDNILDPWHRKVNLGLAWDTHQMWTVQHFEGDYVDCDVPPTIEGTTLRLSCTAKEVFPSNSFVQQIFYDPPPHTLTRGQLSRSSSYYYGDKVALLREQPMPGYSWLIKVELVTRSSGCTPYDVDPALPPPASLADATSRFPWFCLRRTNIEPVAVPYITGEETINGRAFALSHDIEPVLSEHGAGVYTLVVWGCSVPDSIDNPCEDDNAMVILQKSIFYETQPPDTYTPTQTSPTTPTPTATPVPAVTPTPTATPAPVATPTPTATPTLVATPISVSAPRVDCGSAVTDTSNAALVADCEYLLGMKSNIRGSAKLNWWSGRALDKWDGVKVEGGRVVELSLPNRKLDGIIPVGIGNLSSLRMLDLSSNSLTGEIPASLNNLTALTKWRLAGNGLSGCVPANLFGVSDSDAASLNLPSCGGGPPPPAATPTPIPTATPTPTPPTSNEDVWAPAGDTPPDSVLRAYAARCDKEDVEDAFDDPLLPLEKFNYASEYADQQNSMDILAVLFSTWNDPSLNLITCKVYVFGSGSSASIEFSYDLARRIDRDAHSDVIAESKIPQSELPEIGDEIIGLRAVVGSVDPVTWKPSGTKELVLVTLYRKGSIVVAMETLGIPYGDDLPLAAHVEVMRRIDARLRSE